MNRTLSQFLGHDSLIVIETLAGGQERVLESRSHPSPIAYLKTDQVAQENLQ